MRCTFHQILLTWSSEGQ